MLPVQQYWLAAVLATQLPKMEGDSGRGEEGFVVAFFQITMISHTRKQDQQLPSPTGTSLHSHVLRGNEKRKVQDSDCLLDNKSTNKLDKEHRRIQKKKPLIQSKYFYLNFQMNVLLLHSFPSGLTFHKHASE